MQGKLKLLTSELTLLEVLVLPFRRGDAQLQADYERTLLGGELRLIPITQPILREAARLRATVTSLRTPDALHAATSRLQNCGQFITNDLGFNQVTELPVVVLRDMITR